MKAYSPNKAHIEIKGKLIRSDTIRRPVLTFFNQLVNVVITKPEAVKVQEHEMVTVTLASLPPALTGGMVPGTSLELKIDLFSHSSSGLCYTLLQSPRFLWSASSYEVLAPN